MINVLISVNQAYLPHVQVMLRSLKSRTDEDVEIYLLNHTLDADTCAGLSDWAKSCGMVLHVIDVFETQLDGLPNGLVDSASRCIIASLLNTYFQRN